MTIPKTYPVSYNLIAEHTPPDPSENLGRVVLLYS